MGRHGLRAGLASTAAVVAIVAGLGVGGPASAGGGTSPDATVKRAFGQVERFWSAEFSAAFDKRFVRLPDPPIPYGFDDGQPGCGTPDRSPYQENAFYCPNDDFIAYDSVGLVPRLQRQYGPISLGVLIAHEYGHRVQNLTGVFKERPPTIFTELQADCYAGAWVSGGARAAFDDRSELDNGLAALLDIRDRVGGIASEPGSHGSGFDRISAFQLGYDKGVQRCAKLVAHPPEVFEVPFSDNEEAATGGNLPVRSVIDLTTQDLDDYWTRSLRKFRRITATTPYELDGALPRCLGKDASPARYRARVLYCHQDRSVAWDQAFLEELSGGIGDLAVAVQLSGAWVTAVQAELDLETTGEDAQLQADCLTGTWFANIIRQDRDPFLTLSPGDLDEAVQTILFVPAHPGGVAVGVSGFDRIRSFRKGIDGDLRTCGIRS